MKNIVSLVSTVFLLIGMMANAQEKSPPSNIGVLPNSTYVPSIASQIENGTAKFASNRTRAPRAKGTSTPIIVPGKGSSGIDELALLQEVSGNSFQTRSPEVVFTADVSQSTPSDPTGAAGPNHYVAAWNVGFRVFNKDGTPATEEMGLNTLFAGNSSGDPIVFFDAHVDNGLGEPRGRFVITEFRGASEPGGNGFDVAVSAGPDPVNDGWFIYSVQFNASVFPDYTKFSVWGDSYIVTANINSPTEQVFALERNKMINNEPAQFITFGLPGIETANFYSPQGFHTTSDQTVPAGTPAPIIYQQDDAWSGVSNDHLKIWELSADWSDLSNSSIQLSQEISVTDFVGVFDGGSFSNIPQLGGPDVDALQATMMNQVQYRRFATYNTVVFNFVVNVASPEVKAGMRWYELRQTSDGEPWSIHQEGTYVLRADRNAYQGSVVMDSQGNIAMGYISSSENDRIKMHYTGRYSDDPLGVMTVIEQDLFVSTAACPTDRLADYTHMTLDPVDDSFWYISEQFEPSRRDIVGNFNLDRAIENDISTFRLVTPSRYGRLTETQNITIEIKNYGSNAITNPTLQYSIDGGIPVIETYDGVIEPFETVTYTFTQTADLSQEGASYTIAVETNFENDSNIENNTIVETVVSGVCEPESNCSEFGDGVVELSLGDQSSYTLSCNGSGYVDATNITFNFSDRESLSGTLQMGYDGSVYAIWIDINDDLNFTNNELVASGVAPNGGEEVNVTLDVSQLDETLLVDGPLLMRVRGEDESASGEVTNPCDQLEYGKTTDFTAVFEAEVLATETISNTLNSLQIISNENNQFDVIFNSDYEGRFAIAVYNLLGQRLAYNNLRRTEGRFTHELDMSYVSSGVYIVKVLDIDSLSQRVEKIIVK